MPRPNCITAIAVVLLSSAALLTSLPVSAQTSDNPGRGMGPMMNEGGRANGPGGGYMRGQMMNQGGGHGMTNCQVQGHMSGPMMGANGPGGGYMRGQMMNEGGANCMMNGQMQGRIPGPMGANGPGGDYMRGQMMNEGGASGMMNGQMQAHMSGPMMGANGQQQGD